MRGKYATNRMRCPGCGEPAVHRPPADLVPWQAHGISRPAWSHADGSSLCPAAGPGGYQPAGPEPVNGPGVTMAGLEPPASDAEFLESCGQLAGVLREVAGELRGWVGELEGLNLPVHVVYPLRGVACALANAAAWVTQASETFRTEFRDARQAAASGLAITGADAP